MHGSIHPQYGSIHTECVFKEFGFTSNGSIQMSSGSIHPANGSTHSWMGQLNLKGVLKDFLMPSMY